MAELKDGDFSYRNLFQLYSKGYPGETFGVEPNDESWHPGTSAFTTQKAKYYYNDSNNGGNNNSSRVYIDVTDGFRAEKLSGNRIKITVNTVVSSIERVHFAGDPIGNIPGWYYLKRNVWFYPDINTAKADYKSGSRTLYQINNWAIDDYSHKGGFSFGGEREIILEPGQTETFTNTIFVYNWATDHQDNPWPGDGTWSQYVDSMGCGVAFRNNLKKEIGHGIIYHWQDSKDQTDEDTWQDEEECSTRSIISKVITRPHWIFEGWATSPNGSPRYHAGDRITVCEETVHLYAIWRYTYQ